MEKLSKKFQITDIDIRLGCCCFFKFIIYDIFCPFLSTCSTDFLTYSPDSLSSALLGNGNSVSILSSSSSFLFLSLFVGSC